MTTQYILLIILQLSTLYFIYYADKKFFSEAKKASNEKELGECYRFSLLVYILNIMTVFIMLDCLSR